MSKQKNKKNRKNTQPAKVKVDPNKTARIANEAMALARSGDPQTAYKMLVKANERAPKHAAILLNLAHVCIALDKFDEATASMQKAMRYEPSYRDQVRRMGSDHDRFGRFEASLSCFSALAGAYPQESSVLCDLGEILLAAGQVEQGVENLERSLELDNNQARSYYSLSRIKPLSDGQIAGLEKCSAEITGDDARFADYALGMQKHYAGEFSAAIDCWKKACSVTPSNFDRSPRQSVDDLIGHTNLLIDLFGSGNSFSQPLDVEPVASPLFLVGMPCAGQHSLGIRLSGQQGYAFSGANPWFNQAIGKMLQQCEGNFRELVNKLDIPARKHFRQEYLKSINPLDKAGVVYVDANPYNFLNIWLIAMILPEAKVLHCQRDDTETAACIFATDDIYQPYTRDLSCIAEYGRTQQRLMDFWSDAIPGMVQKWPFTTTLSTGLPAYIELSADAGAALPKDLPQFASTAQNYSEYIQQQGGNGLNFDGFNLNFKQPDDSGNSSGGSGLKLNFD